MGIGQSIVRLDALEKVIGTAKFTEDLLPENHLVARCLGSKIANGTVLSIKTDKALSLAGVECVLTCFDLPQKKYPTAGHPYSLDPNGRDIADKVMLTSRVRFVGDEIAVVVAKNELIAEEALSLIEVQYEEYPPLLNVEAASKGQALHPDLFPNNTFSTLNYYIKENKLECMGENETEPSDEELYSSVCYDAFTKLESTFYLPPVHACHIENISCFAYMEGKRITIVTATQTPHIVRRIVSEAIEFPLGDIRVIKPYVGGAFGNKQDIYYEPLAAYLTKYLGGKCVSFMLKRESTFTNSRTRHGMIVKTKAAYNDNQIKVRSAEFLCEQGAYAAHGHAIAANAITNFAHLYRSEHCFCKSTSTYMNRPSGGALRAYGIPQSTFVMECFADDMAEAIGTDPLEFRLQHLVKPGYVDPFCGIEVHETGLEQCIRRGATLSDYHGKRTRYKTENLFEPIRRGIGMAVYIYTTGLGRIALETSSVRLILNQDGSLILQTGAVDFGQGSDTVLAQMASEILKISENQIHVVSSQDTDVCPYDIGTFSSRVSYVAGSAVKQTAGILKAKILERASNLLSLPRHQLDLSSQGVIIKDAGTPLLSLEELAYRSLYSMVDSQQITAESTYCMTNNAFSFGACFADIEIDVLTGQIKVKKITSVLDSGRILNPALAVAQVHGGVSMGLGYALTEQMLFDDKGLMLNNNLLDYKIPTVMDMPEMEVDFIETYEPTAPFGNKSLGEPPTIAVAPAIRNALLHATGVAINRLPLTPQRVLKAINDYEKLTRR